jgi:hypothetical protein
VRVAEALREGEGEAEPQSVELEEGEGVRETLGETLGEREMLGVGEIERVALGEGEFEGHFETVRVAEFLPVAERTTLPLDVLQGVAEEDEERKVDSVRVGLEEADGQRDEVLEGERVLMTLGESEGERVRELQAEVEEQGEGEGL